VGASVALASLPLLQPIFRGEAAASVPGPSFQDGFDRPELGPHWWSAGGPWMLRGGRLRWLVDGAEFLVFEDPRPLEGAGHDRFGFSSWDADVFFDDLRVEPLGDKEIR
jgi:hypothetical protein